MEQAAPDPGPPSMPPAPENAERLDAREAPVEGQSSAITSPTAESRGQQASQTTAFSAEETHGQQEDSPLEPTDPLSNPHSHAALEVDSTDDERDSAYAESILSSTASLASSITNYLYENGRRYHAYKEGEYFMPNDEAEQDRLDLQHHIWNMCLGGAFYIAPVKDPRFILDIGTGTGIWAIQLADTLPDATIIGTDLSPIQPGFVPPNTRFFVDDFEEPWVFSEAGQFDLIHWRALSGSTGDFPKLYGQAMRDLQPGGYLEVHEYDADIYSDDDPAMKNAPWSRAWCETLQEASIGFGKALNVGRFHKQWMEEAGFLDVHEKVVKCPIGPWTKNPALKELGRYERWHMNESVESHSMALYTRVLNKSVDEAKITFEMVRQEFNNKRLHLYTVYRFLYGRKP